ncbi:hypothetical protein [Leifsonia sp. AG29]|uniref:hypothetical protein n=1 Tax=Leifsonia sp. AG29 TaxID=2598860 RepID=UPI001E6316DA|nr:hypothetical protein [Leifsonia sp. AG29]
MSLADRAAASHTIHQGHGPLPDAEIIERHAEAFVHGFVEREAWVSLLVWRGTVSGRRRFRARLAEPLPLAAGRRVDVTARGERFALEAMRRLGAPEACVLVKDGLLEDELTTLQSALHRAYLSGSGALVSAVPGRLCFVQSADGTRQILYRPRETSPASR